VSTPPARPLPRTTVREKQARESYLRWQKLSTTQLGSVVKLVLTLNVGALAFGADLLAKRKTQSGLWCYFVAMAILLGAALLGLLISWTRMMSFRWTTRSARMAQLYEEDWAVKDYRPLPWVRHELDADQLLEHAKNTDESSLPAELRKKLREQEDKQEQDQEQERRPSPSATRSAERKRESLDQKTWRTIRDYCREQYDKWDRCTLWLVPGQFVLFLCGVALLAVCVWWYPIGAAEDPRKITAGAVQPGPHLPSAAIPVPAPTPEYRVRRGDTLASIAREHYNDATRWTEIYQRNRAAIGADPNALQPGQRLLVP